MDGGGSVKSSEERGAEKLMDDYLKSIGLHRKKIAKDGSCLFRAVAEQVLHSQSHHTKVRTKCVEFLQKNRELYEAFIEGDFDDYLCKIQDPQQWVGEVEINALAVMYKRDFLIFQEPGKPAVNITGNNFKDKVQLCFMNGNHYDSVYPINHFKNAALCQSVLYELLYDRVFNVDRSFLGSCQRVSRQGDVLSDDNMAACGSSDESGPDTGEALWVESETTTVTRHYRGRGRRGPLLPERVRRSLNPTLFRNVEYDVWNKNKRAQQKMDYCIAAGMQFVVGDRCQVLLDGSGRSYSATVKEVSPNSGPVTVYIEELGRKQVPLWSLRPPSDESSWSTVVGRDKRLSNGHGEWEERGKGRGRGKHVPGSSSVSQVAAVSSSGRMQKQHSWTQQASVEEQGGVKHSRKSVSSVEPAFGLTEEQRLAKEEEEMNVALVEIQLRDEHSFPALGTQPEMPCDGGRKKGGEKAKSQRNKMKSPVEDVIAPSPSAGERPRSSTPPLADAPATTAPTTNTAAPTNSVIPTAPSTNSDSTPADPDVAPSAVASNLPLTCAAPIAITNAPSLPATSSSPPAATSAQRTKPPILGGATPSAGFSLLAPVLPTASSASVANAHSSSSLPPSSFCSLVSESSASTPPSSLPPPTFISPIAPSPTAAQSFLPSSSLPRCSPPVPSLPHSLYSSSSSLKSDAVPVHEGPVSTQTPNIEATPFASQTFQSQASQSQILPKGSLPQGQNQTLNHNQPYLPQNQTMMPQMRADTESCAPHDEPQLHTEVASLPESCPPSVLSAQASVPHLQPQHVPQSPAAADQVQASHRAPETSLETSQASGPAPLVPQPSVTQPQLHVQLEQPPHPSQVPHPSLSQSVSHTYPPPHSQTSSTNNQSEASLPSSQMQPESPVHGAFQQQPHLSHPHLPTMFAHIHPQPIPGTVPLQQLPQLYQDPLYPGFPLGEKGTMAPTPSYSSSKSGDDLPQEINILRFFFNLGVKAYSMPMIAPYFYLYLLQHAHTMQSQVHSSCNCPTHHYPTSKPPTQHQEAYPHPPYPSSPSVPLQYDQTPLIESSQPSDTYSQAGYTVTEPPPHHITGPTLQWQQHHFPPPTNPSFPVGYPAPYSIPQHFPQSYHPSQVPGLPRYPSGLPSHPLPSLGYQSSSAPEELQVNQGTIDQHQPANGDTPGRLPAAVTTNITTANNNKTVMLPSYAVKTESGENLTRAVLLVDPPLDNKPILISNSGIKDVPVSRATMKTGSNPGCPLPDIISKTTGPVDNKQFRSYRGHQKVLINTSTFSSLGAPERGQGCLAAMAEPSSVGCNTEDNWEEEVEFRKSPSHHRGSRRNYRGGFRGRGHDSGRGTNRRRQGGDAGAGISYSQYGSSYRGRGQERGY